METGLVRYDAARKALQAAHSIDEVKEIRARAEAMRLYAKQAQDHDMALWAAEIKLRAERKAGEIIPEMQKNGELAKRGQPRKENLHVASLSDHDIDHTQSARWQMEAAISDERFEQYIDECKEKGDIPTSKELRNIGKKDDRRSEIDAQRAAISRGEIVRPDGLFDVISIDPPWPYGNEDQYDGTGYRVASPYPEMPLEDLAAMEIPASDNCVLWLWTTHKFMRHSFDLLDAWGFEDKAILTWVKDRMGTGRWLRSKSEFCIMAVRGKPLIDLTNQTTILEAPLREHSRKPEEFYAFVESLCVGRMLDFFSRESREGWAQVGNDAEKFQ